MNLIVLIAIIIVYLVAVLSIISAILYVVTRNRNEKKMQIEEQNDRTEITKRGCRDQVANPPANAGGAWQELELSKSDY